MKPEDAKRLQEIRAQHLHQDKDCSSCFMLRVIDERGKEREEFRKRMRLAQTFAMMSKLFVTDEKIREASPLRRAGCVCGGAAPSCDCGWFHWIAQAEVLQCIPGSEVPDGDCDQCEGDGSYEDEKVTGIDGFPMVRRCPCWITALDPKVVLGKDPA